MLDTEKYISTKEAATLLGYSLQHTRLLIRQGQLRAEKFGRDWMVEKDAALELKWSVNSDDNEVDIGIAESPTEYESKDPKASDAWSIIQTQAEYSSDRYCLLLGDACERLSSLPDNVINTCLTSPPYWRARDYEHTDQIGLEDDPDEYIGKLVETFREVRRALREDGTVWLNIGDCYLNGYNSRRKSWQKNKQLALIPFRLAIALQEDGWWVRNSIVWHKPNAMPASVRDRLANTWEPIFLLTKSDKYYFDLDAIRVPHRTDDLIERMRAENGQANGKAKGKKELRRWLTSPRHRATIDGLKEIRRRPNAPRATELATYLRGAAEKKGVSIRWVAKQLDQPFERVRHYFRTDEIGSRLPPEDTWEQLKDLLELDTTHDDAMAVEIGDNVFRNHPKGRNPGDMQSIALSGNGIEHFATMPDQLAKWCLKASLPKDGICLDPFMGVGTTGLIALELHGRFLGIDIRADFLKSASRLLVEV